MTLDEGAIIGGYRLGRRLGDRGGATVFEARQQSTGRLDEITVRAPGHGDEFRDRYRRTAERAAAIGHPNLAAVFDAGVYGGRLWIATQHIDGVDAAAMTDRGGVDVTRAARIVAAAARGLGEVHRAGLRHGDVRPSDIRVVERPGAADLVVLTGHGIARAATDPVTFPAPEQRSGGAGDQRADVYALGCTLYSMLTGTSPDPEAIVPPPSRANPWVPAALDAVVARATADRPQDRYPDGGALAAALDAAIETKVADPPRPPRRMLWSAAVAVLVLLVAVAVAVWTVTVRGEESAAPATSTDARSPELKAALWGAYAYVADAFPRLLPVSVDGIGFDELTHCTPVDDGLRPVSLYESARIGRVMCGGNSEPVVGIVIECMADRSRVTPRPADWAVGGERWTRPSGSGQARWGDYQNTEGARLGRVEVYFDDAARDFCKVQINGRAAGAELHARWWPGAPV